MKRKRTSHSDLANIVDKVAADLSKLPTTYIVGHPTNINALQTAAEVLYQQDLRIEQLELALQGTYGKKIAAVRRHKQMQ